VAAHCSLFPAHRPRGAWSGCFGDDDPHAAAGMRPLRVPHRQIASPRGPTSTDMEVGALSPQVSTEAQDLSRGWPASPQPSTVNATAGPTPDDLSQFGLYSSEGQQVPTGQTVGSEGVLESVAGWDRDSVAMSGLPVASVVSAPGTQVLCIAQGAIVSAAGQELRLVHALAFAGREGIEAGKKSRSETFATQVQVYGTTDDGGWSSLCTIAASTLHSSAITSIAFKYNSYKLCMCTLGPALVVADCLELSRQGGLLNAITSVPCNCLPQTNFQSAWWASSDVSRGSQEEGQFVFGSQVGEDVLIVADTGRCRLLFIDMTSGLCLKIVQIKARARPQLAQASQAYEGGAAGSFPCSNISQLALIHESIPKSRSVLFVVSTSSPNTDEPARVFTRIWFLDLTIETTQSLQGPASKISDVLLAKPGKGTPPLNPQCWLEGFDLQLSIVREASLSPALVATYNPHTYILDVYTLSSVLFRSPAVQELRLESNIASVLVTSSLVFGLRPSRDAGLNEGEGPYELLVMGRFCVGGSMSYAKGWAVAGDVPLSRFLQKLPLPSPIVHKSGPAISLGPLVSCWCFVREPGTANKRHAEKALPQVLVCIQGQPTRICPIVRPGTLFQAIVTRSTSLSDTKVRDLVIEVGNCTRNFDDTWEVHKRVEGHRMSQDEYYSYLSEDRRPDLGSLWQRSCLCCFDISRAEMLGTAIGLDILQLYRVRWTGLGAVLPRWG